MLLNLFLRCLNLSQGQFFQSIYMSAKVLQYLLDQDHRQRKLQHHAPEHSEE